MASYDKENNTACVTIVNGFNRGQNLSLNLNSSLNGKTLRKILSDVFDGMNVISIDIHDGLWHDGNTSNCVLDTVYNHDGNSYIDSKHTSLNYQDVINACIISSAGGLRVFVR